MAAPDNIVLTGFMATGKTEVGRVLARRLGFAFFDVDAEIERCAGMSVPEIFSAFGEAGFRARESEVISTCPLLQHTVIASGGGAVIRPENLAALRDCGLLICLTASVETILDRAGNGETRPLLQGADPKRRVRELLEAREPYYNQADFIVRTDGKNPQEIVAEIVEQIGFRKNAGTKG
ncbi:MAG TPA: shikimate kinase [Dissulfurispiraceae bacterium]|nr:shikimate kinase [Dissulfurispiraceae bacterium]